MKARRTSILNRNRFKQFRSFFVLLIAGALVISSLAAPGVSAAIVPTESTIALNTSDAIPLQGTLQVVSNNPGNESSPHVQCTLASYTYDDFEGRSTFHYHDLSTNTDNVIPGDDIDLLSDVSGSRVAYTEVDYPGDHIMVFDTATQTRTVVPGYGRSDPSIGGNIVAFEDRSSVPASDWRITQITAYDLNSGTIIPITNDLSINRRPDVSPNGEAIVWQKCQNDYTDCDVYSAVQTAPGVFTTHALTVGDGADWMLPSTNGELAVYVSNRNGDDDVYYQPVGGGAEVRLAIPGNQRWPRISESLISFESPGPNGYDSYIYVYDIISRKLYSMGNTRIYGYFLSDIDVCNGVGRIFYSVVGQGAFDVELFSFQVPGSTPDEINDLIALVRAFNLPHGTENSLVTKLQSALSAVGRSDTATACTALTSFINECRAQSGKKLTTEQSAQLISLATQIKTELGCP